MPCDSATGLDGPISVSVPICDTMGCRLVTLAEAEVPPGDPAAAEFPLEPRIWSE